jgi:hypothetical protein
MMRTLTTLLIPEDVMELDYVHPKSIAKEGWSRQAAMKSLTGAAWWAISAALAVTPALSPASNQREIPFENSRVFGLFLVRVEANGRPAVLIVDTGSSVTIISPDLADVAPGSVDNAASPTRGSGFRGRGVFKRATLKVGCVTWRDRKVVVTDTRELSKTLGQRVDGMLGIDLLSELGVIVVDFKNHKLILGP